MELLGSLWFIFKFKCASVYSMYTCIIIFYIHTIFEDVHWKVRQWESSLELLISKSFKGPILKSNQQQCLVKVETWWIISVWTCLFSSVKWWRSFAWSLRTGWPLFRLCGRTINLQNPDPVVGICDYNNHCMLLCVMHLVYINGVVILHDQLVCLWFIWF